MMPLKSETKFNAMLVRVELGRAICFCSSSPPAPAPDPNIGIAAQQNAEVAHEALQFSKDMYADYKPYLERLAQKSIDIGDMQQKIAEDQAAQATDYTDYMKGTFRPVEQSLVDEAQSYDAATKGAANADRAETEVNKAYDAQQKNIDINNMGFGINPNSGRTQALQRRFGVEKAADVADARTKAYNDAETVGWAKRMDAAGLGRNLPSNQATSAGLATSAGSSAVNTAQAPGQGFGIGQNIMNSGYGTAISGNNSAGNLYLGQYGAQMQGWNAQQQANATSSAGIGSLVGTIGGAFIGGPMGAAAGKAMFSSKKVKTDKTPIDGDKALEALDATPVEAWTYKPGVEDSGRHIGPYAEDVQKNFGMGDGKSVNLMDELGVTMAAVKALSKKVDRMQAGFGMKRG